MLFCRPTTAPALTGLVTSAAATSQGEGAYYKGDNANITINRN